MDQLSRTFLLLVFCQVYMHCYGFDFTIRSHSRDAQGTSKDHQSCGMLLCTETLSDPSNNSSSDNSRKLTSISISKNRPNEGGSGTSWQQLASVTPRQTELNRVSDGVRITGKISDHRGELSLELFKVHDCHESQFSCVVAYVDSQGKTSVTKSIVGKEVDVQQGPNPQLGGIRASMAFTDKIPDDQLNSAITYAQVMNAFQSKFDSILARLGDSLRDMENRLEDKVADMRVSMDNRVNGLQNRLEDKLSEIHLNIIKGFGQTQPPNSDGAKDNVQLVLKIDEVENKLGGKIDTCINKVSSLENSCRGKENISSQLAPVIRSIKSMAANLSSYDESVAKVETIVDKWTVATAAEDATLTGLVSGVSSLYNLTLNLVSQVTTLTNSYAGGALVPVEEFSDPFRIGKKEWKLVFRGTAYNNVEVYPAYLYGTGIPIEVEEGCKQFTRSLPCVNHYRNGVAFDNWVGIDEVLFAIYKDGQMVQNVLFNGKGSTYTNWFSANRVISSSWNDLTSQPHNFFSIEGHLHQSAGHTRRFHINRDYDRGCDGFQGWFTVKDSVINGCAAENTVAMPMFQYAAAKTFAAWNGENVDRADAIGIFLKYE